MFAVSKVGPYFFAELLCRAFFESVNALFLATPCYFMVGLQSDIVKFGTFFLVLSLLSVMGASIGIVVGTMTKDIQEAQGMIIPILMPLMLFSGFFLPFRDIPSFFRWLYEISFLRYGFNILKVNQWSGVDFDDCDVSSLEGVCPVTCYPNGKAYLAKTEASELSMATNFLILAGFLVAITLFSFVSMRRAIIAKSKQG